jgi:hypothetical protein
LGWLDEAEVPLSDAAVLRLTTVFDGWNARSVGWQETTVFGLKSSISHWARFKAEGQRPKA